MTHVQGGLNGHRRERVGEDVFEDDPEPGVTHHPGGVDVVLLAHLQDLTSDDAGVASPHDEGQCHHDVREGRPQDGGDGEREDQRRDREEHIHHPHQDGVHPAAEDAGDAAYDHAHRQGSGHHVDRELQREPRPPHDPVQHVLSPPGGAEGMSGASRRHGDRTQVARHLVGAAGIGIHDERGEDRHPHHQHDDDEADQGAAPAEDLPGGAQQPPRPHQRR